MNYFDQIVIYRNKNKNPIIHMMHNVHAKPSIGSIRNSPYIYKKNVGLIDFKENSLILNEQTYKCT